ncbi:MAG: hypothetical protein IPP71_20215 [Bacteroidetes bacterium]|nr:hypothetical protein [Bacteroidota bacterium]
MKWYLILGLLVVSAAKLTFAQDPHFSQIQYNPLYLNPHLQVLWNMARQIVWQDYTDQWRTLPVPTSTTAI